MHKPIVHVNELFTPVRKPITRPRVSYWGVTIPTVKAVWLENEVQKAPPSVQIIGHLSSSHSLFAVPG